MKIINFILNVISVISAITLYVVAISIISFIVEYMEVEVYASYVLYFGAGGLIYHPIKYIFKN